MNIDTYEGVLIWAGAWEVQEGMILDGFHVWNRRGEWVGVYTTHSKARSHAETC